MSGTLMNGRSLLPESVAAPYVEKDLQVQSLKELLESVDEMEKAEIDKFRTLADELTANSQRYLVVESFKAREDKWDSTENADYFCKPIPDRFSNNIIRVYPRNNWEISLSFKSMQAYSMWKTCTLAALFKLQIDEATLSLCPSELSDGFKVNSSLEETKNILRFLQPLACVSHFELITIEDETDDIVHMFRQFLIHSSVHAVQFSPEMHKSRMLNNGRREVADFAPWLNLVRNIEPTIIIYYRISITEELRVFLGEIADVVEYLWITGTTKSYTDDHIISIILDILRGKCNNLYISDAVGIVSFAQIKQIIQYFKTTNQKVTLTVPTYGDLPIGERIDDYELKSDNTSATRNMVIIEHISIQPTTNDQWIDIISKKRSIRKNSASNILSPVAKRRAIESKSTNNDEYGLIEILNFADDRQISIGCAMKETSTTCVIVERLAVRKDSSRMISVSFTFCSFIERHIWCSVFKATTAKVGLEGHIFVTRNTSIATNGTQSVLWTIRDAELDKLERVLKYMRPLIRKTHFKHANIAVNHPEVLRMSAELLEGSSTEKLRIDALNDGEFRNRIEITDFDPWIDMIRRGRPLSIECSEFLLSKRMMNFLILTAEVVEEISLLTLIHHDQGVHSTSFLRELLARKCANVVVRGSYTKITQDKVEELLQSFHHRERKVSLTIHVYEPINEIQIGEYKVEIIPAGFLMAAKLVIKHCDAPQNAWNI